MSLFRIRIGGLFRKDPKFAVHLIRLMAIVNDFNSIKTCMTDLLTDPDDPIEQRRVSGHRAYFFRLTFSHLHEAAKVLKEISRDCPNILETAPRGLNEIYNRIAVTIYPHERGIARLRHKTGSHYDFSELELVLREWGAGARGEIITGKTLGENRYPVAEEALLAVVSKAFSLPSNTEDSGKKLSDLLAQLLPLQVHLTEYVDWLLATAQESDPGVIEPIPSQPEGGTNSTK